MKNNIVREFLDIQTEIKELKKRGLALKEEILKPNQEKISQQLIKKDYGCGTATVDEFMGYQLKVEVGKDVKWDLDQLAALYEEIKAAGQDPNEYIDVKLSVSENKFKSWPSNIQQKFVNARTVKAKKPILKVIEGNEND